MYDPAWRDKRLELFRPNQDHQLGILLYLKMRSGGANDAFIPTGYYQIVNYLSTGKVDSEDTMPKNGGMKPVSEDILVLTMDETGKGGVAARALCVSIANLCVVVTLQKTDSDSKESQKQRVYFHFRVPFLDN